LNGQQFQSQSSYSLDEFCNEDRFRQCQVLGRIFSVLESVSGVGLTDMVERSEAASASCSTFSGSIILLSFDGGAEELGPRCQGHGPSDDRGHVMGSARRQSVGPKRTPRK
jgi:hypothetical protein